MNARKYRKLFLFMSTAILTALACSLPGGDAPGSIRGVVWHDVCQFTGGEAGEPVVLGQGCVQWGEEDWEFGPDQVYDDFEEGWEGVTLHLGAGPCPSTGLATSITDSDGQYSFEPLEAGTYCISYDPLADGNDAILIPGQPTYPIRGEGGNQRTEELSSGEDLTNIDFGFAWQFYN